MVETPRDATTFVGHRPFARRRFRTRTKPMASFTCDTGGSSKQTHLHSFIPYIALIRIRKLRWYMTRTNTTLSRRRLLRMGIGGGVLALSGCGESESDGDSTDGGGNGNGGDAGGNDTDASGDGGGDGEASSNKPDVVNDDPKLITVDAGYYSGPAGEVAVTNDGDAPARALRLNFDWLDENGDYIDTSSLSVQLLQNGETLVARRKPTLVDEPEKIKDVELSLEGGREAAKGLNPDGVELTEDKLRASEDEVRVRGVARNDRDSELGYLAAVATVYDSDDRALAVDYTNETDIGAGEEWRFEIPSINTVARNKQVESATVVLSENQLTF